MLSSYLCLYVHVSICVFMLRLTGRGRKDRQTCGGREQGVRDVELGYEVCESYCFVHSHIKRVKVGSVFCLFVSMCRD